jgi:hypothetical protein
MACNRNSFVMYKINYLCVCVDCSTLKLSTKCVQDCLIYFLSMILIFAEIFPVLLRTKHADATGQKRPPHCARTNISYANQAV